MTQQIVLASRNRGKLVEIRKLLERLPVKIIPQTDLGLNPVEETGQTFVENALLKARAACQDTALPAIADDSGLEVGALNGAPGIYSARFAGSDARDPDNIKHLLDAMRDVEEGQRQARFVCIAVFLRHAHDSVPLVAQGFWEGSIAMRPQGRGGFGYDPVFYLPQFGATVAQLNAGDKNRYSHRSKAFRSLANLLEEHIFELP